LCNVENNNYNCWAICARNENSSGPFLANGNFHNLWRRGEGETGSWENGKAGMKYIFKHNVTGVAKATTARRFSLQPLSLLLG